tara:strand:- start:529 stop:675 length:147 start_codon:yes stop_codon:yes gene_type:complete
MCLNLTMYRNTQYGAMTKKEEHIKAEHTNNMGVQERQGKVVVAEKESS